LVNGRVRQNVSITKGEAKCNKIHLSRIIHHLKIVLPTATPALTKTCGIESRTLVRFIFDRLHSFFSVGIYVINQLEIRPTVLILKRDACDLMREHGVSTEPHGAESCRVTVPYKGSVFPAIGTLHLPDENITMPADQVTVVGIMNSATWTPLQIGLISWQIVSVILPIIFLVLLGRTLI
jgi:hypothetical protein